ncbi:Uncharacterised protein [Mobiluncus mulieris]|nr:Uncharacterised protein [Mobiluncus mulieris]
MLQVQNLRLMRQPDLVTAINGTDAGKNTSKGVYTLTIAGKKYSYDAAAHGADANAIVQGFEPGS